MTTSPATTKLTFQAELLRLMARHRYAGVPGRVATIIRAAAATGDQETLQERLPAAVAQMMTQAGRQP